MTYELTQADKDAATLAHKELDGHMCCKFYQGGCIQSEVMEAGLDLDDNAIYARLSADGFLDCTELTGPHDSVADAANELIRLYGEG